MDIVIPFLLFIPIYLGVLYINFVKKPPFKRRYFILILMTLWVIVWWNFPEATLVFSLPLFILIFFYLLFLWISIMFWGITGKDPFWITFLKKFDNE